MGRDRGPDRGWDMGHDTEWDGIGQDMDGMVGRDMVRDSMGGWDGT